MMKKDIFIDPKLKSELLWGIQLCTKEDDDFVIAIDGKEGAGKSVLARQIGHYINSYLGKPFNEHYIHFDTEPYIENSEQHKDEKGHVLILDESRSALNVKNTMSRQNKQFTNWFSECRNSNHIHILVLPYIHDLDKYLTRNRVNILLSVQKFRTKDKSTISGWKLVRGKYFKINPDMMMPFIEKKNKYGSYRYPKIPANFSLEFNNSEPLSSVESYNEKKNKWRLIKSSNQNEKKEESTTAEQKSKELDNLQQNIFKQSSESKKFYY